MRKSYERQFRFGATPIAQLEMNLNCRDEIIPVLVALRHVYLNQLLRTRLTKWIAEDLSDQTRRDTGRPGLDDWQVLVLAVLRSSCNLDYDKLQDLAENHLRLRTMLGVDGWDQDVSFDYRRIRSTLTDLRPRTIDRISQAIVQHGQKLHGNAATTARADCFVIETNIHYPTESSLMYDGMRKMIPLAVQIAGRMGLSGWRQAKHLLGKIKKLHRAINQLSASRVVNKKDAMESLYCDLIDRVTLLIDRAKGLKTQVSIGHCDPALSRKVQQLGRWIDLTEQVRNTAHRRVVLGERVPNRDKLFSLFETHTQLYQRGKAGEPVQYGRLALIFEDGAGFISHSQLLDREATDLSVAVDQTARAQSRHGGQLASLSLDRGFHSACNVEQLVKIVAEVSCPSRNAKHYAVEVAGETKESRRRRHRHAGVESAIGALQRGNGLRRCRDRSEAGLQRYLALAVLGRNLQVLGKLLITQQAPDSSAAFSLRQPAA